MESARFCFSFFDGWGEAFAKVAARHGLAFVSGPRVRTVQFFTDEELDRIEARIAAGELYPFLRAEGWQTLSRVERQLLTRPRVQVSAAYECGPLGVAVMHVEGGQYPCIVYTHWTGSVDLPDAFVSLGGPQIAVVRDELIRTLNPRAFKAAEDLRRWREQNGR